MSKNYDAFALKMIAIIGMAMQHTVLVLGELIPTALHFPLQFGGGFTFPIMAFFLVEGYRHTRNFKKYATRIFIFALISQVPHMMSLGTIDMGFNFFLGNIMFTLFVGLVILWMYDNMKKRWLFWLLFVLLSFITLACDWGLIGPVMILLYHTIKTEKLKRTVVPFLAFWFNIIVIVGIAFVVGLAVAMGEILGDPDLMYAFEQADDINLFHAFAGFLFPVGMLASIPILRRFNGERGRSMKYLFYAFYPLHLLAIALLAYVLGVNESLIPW